VAAVKNILKHVSAEVAGRKRKCYRKQTHVVLKGEKCLVVQDGPQNQTTYCAVCASEILARAGATLADLDSHFVETSTVGQAASTSSAAG
jgi:hypothetical protein